MLVKRAEEALRHLELSQSLFGVEADKGRLAVVAMGLRTLEGSLQSYAAELERLLKLYETTGNTEQLLAWLRKMVAAENDYSSPPSKPPGVPSKTG